MALIVSTPSFLALISSTVYFCDTDFQYITFTGIDFQYHIFLWHWFSVHQHKLPKRAFTVTCPQSWSMIQRTCLFIGMMKLSRWGDKYSKLLPMQKPNASPRNTEWKVCPSLASSTLCSCHGLSIWLHAPHLREPCSESDPTVDQRFQGFGQRRWSIRDQTYCMAGSWCSHSILWPDHPIFLLQPTPKHRYRQVAVHSQCMVVLASIHRPCHPGK